MGLATAFALILLINETSSPVYQAFAINAKVSKQQSKLLLRISLLIPFLYKITAQSIVAAFVFRNPMSGTVSRNVLFYDCKLRYLILFFVLRLHLEPWLH